MSLHHLTPKKPTLTPHELEAMREEDLAGLIADPLDGVVGEAEWEKATAGADSMWDLLPIRSLK